MSSSSKTEYLCLNKWSNNDRLTRVDVNYDNEVIDSAVGEHIQDEEIHITSSERDNWNSNCNVFYYLGDGLQTRQIDLGIDFEPKYIRIFATTVPSRICDFENKKVYNYTASICGSDSSGGVSYLGDGKIEVSQSSLPIVDSEYAALNQTGLEYKIIYFR